jgi:hypothetical protein
MTISTILFPWREIRALRTAKASSDLEITCLRSQVIDLRRTIAN